MIVQRSRPDSTTWNLSNYQRVEVGQCDAKSGQNRGQARNLAKEGNDWSGIRGGKKGKKKADIYQRGGDAAEAVSWGFLKKKGGGPE